MKERISLQNLKNRIKIIEYASNQGYTVIKEGKNIYSLKEHDSCKIYPTNTFYRFSNGVGGSIIDFIKEFEKLSTKEAIQRLKEYDEKNKLEVPLSHEKNKKNQKENFSLPSLEIPKKYKNDKSIIFYLTSIRKISKLIVYEYLKKNIIYQDTYKNLIFQGKYNDKVMYITKRGIFADFKQEQAGSITEVGVYVKGKNDETLVLNESVVDQMSFREKFDENGNYNYLSVNGIKKAIPCLQFHLVKREEAKFVKNILIGFDNDKCGKIEATNLKNWLNENYPKITVEILLPKYKDFNEDLVIEKESIYDINGELLEFASAEFQNNKDIFLTAMNEYGDYGMEM